MSAVMRGEDIINLHVQPDAAPVEALALRRELTPEVWEKAIDDLAGIEQVLTKAKARRAAPRWAAPRELWLILLLDFGPEATSAYRFQNRVTLFLALVRQAAANPTSWPSVKAAA